MKHRQPAGESDYKDLTVSIAERLTVSEYDRRIAAGEYDGRNQRRVELIRGEVREMSPIGPPHETTVDRLMVWSVRKAPPKKVIVRIQNSVGVAGLGSAPQPDVAWVALKDYSKFRPTARDVLLLIEASDSSLQYDCGEKADLYATAGIKDYWVVNLPECCVHVYRQPSRGEYRTLQVFSSGQTIPLLAFPRIKFPVSLLFGV